MDLVVEMMRLREIVEKLDKEIKEMKVALVPPPAPALPASLIMEKQTPTLKLLKGATSTRYVSQNFITRLVKDSWRQ